MICEFKDCKLVIRKSAYVHLQAAVTGNVSIGKDAGENIPLSLNIPYVFSGFELPDS